MNCRRNVVFCTLFSLALIVASPCSVYSEISSAEQLNAEAVKAALLPKFIPFIRSKAGLVPDDKICIIGSDPFGAVIDKMAANQGMPGAILRTTEWEVQGCTIAYISAREEARHRAILESLANFSLATVSDIPGFAKAGGTIELILSAGRVQFIVKRASAAKHGIIVSSELLQLAQDVVEEE